MEIQRHRLKNRGMFYISPLKKRGELKRCIHDQLVNKDTNEIVARSHARVRNSFFRKPRNMSLEISSKILPAMDIVLLTFILVWWERQTERLKEPLSELCPNVIPLLPLPVDG